MNSVLFLHLQPDIQTLASAILPGVFLAANHLSATQELKNAKTPGRAVFYWIFGIFVLLLALAASITQPVTFAANLLAGLIYLGLASKAYLSHHANLPSSGSTEKPRD